MEQYISRSAVVAEIDRRIASLESIGSENYLHNNYPKQFAMLVTLKSLKFSINTLEVKEVDLVMHTIIAECCDWLTLHTELSHEQIEDCRNLMLTIKDEQLKAQKRE